MTDAYTDEKGVTRCHWVSIADEFVDYHDKEWGFPVSDDIRLFEKLCLESFQSGLSWRTILSKRDNFRTAFAGFDFRLIAKFDEQDKLRLLEDTGIVRHKGKIEATINNAQRAVEMVAEHGSLARYFWQFEVPDNDPSVRQSQTEQSKNLSKQLKKLGWKFVGPTTVYSFMQAAGLVNDHANDCYCRQLAIKARQQFNKP